MTQFEIKFTLLNAIDFVGLPNEGIRVSAAR